MPDIIVPVPTLSTLGWVSDPVTKFDFLLSHFFLSDYNQTYLYKDYVTSLPRIIEKNGESVEGVIADLRSKLNDYLGRYYDSVDTEVIKINTESDNSSDIKLNINIGITDKGMKNSFSRLMESANGVLQKITKLNNYNK